MGLTDLLVGAYSAQKPHRHMGSELKLVPLESLEESSAERISLENYGKC